MTAHPRRWWSWLFISVLVIVLDQLTKLGADSQFTYGQRLAVLPFFDLTLLYNRGAAFSFLAQEAGWQRWFFTVLGIGASVAMAWMIRRHPGERRACLALALIIGGALGNVIDRLAYGHVIDFLLFHWQERFFPAFNIADSAITVGAVLLILDELLRSRRQSSTQ